VLSDIGQLYATAHGQAEQNVADCATFYNVIIIVIYYEIVLKYD